MRSGNRHRRKPVSVAYAAVSLAQQIFSDLKQDTALLIGAGETIELVARHLVEAGIKNYCRQPHAGKCGGIGQ